MYIYIIYMLSTAYDPQPHIPLVKRPMESSLILTPSLIDALCKVVLAGGLGWVFLSV
jgi:hypothetical protein